MATLAELVVKVGADVSAFSRGLNDSTKQLNKWAKQAEKSVGPVMDGIGRALKIVGVAGAAGFGAAMVASVRGATALESYRNTLNVVMKDQEKAAEIMAWAVEFANRTPFETDSIVQATVRLQSYGLEAQKVLPAIGDMAGVMNKDIMQAVEAVADAQTGELERLKEFGITKAMIVQEGNRIMRGVELVNQKGQIVDQENFNKALFSLMNERFKGGMEIQANSLKGLWSTVTGVAKTTLATMAGISTTGEVIAGGLFDTIKTKIKAVVDQLNEWQKNGTLQEWADKATAAVSTFWGVAEGVFNTLIGAGKWIIDNWGLIGPILAGVLASFMAYRTAQGAISAVTLAQKALNLAMSMNPIGLVVLAIGALVAAGVALYMHWDEVKKKMSDIWQAIKDRAVTIWNSIKSFLVEWWPLLVGALGGPIGLLAGYIYKNWDNIKARTQEIWDNLKAAIIEKVKSWIDIGVSLAQGVWQGLQNMASWLREKVLGWIKSVLPDVIEKALGISSPSEVMAQYGRYVAEGLAQGIAEASGKVKDMSTLMAQAITDALSIVSDKLNLAGQIAQANFNLIKAKMGESIDQGKLLEAGLQSLQAQFDATNSRLAVLQKAYEDMKATKGETAVETQKLQLELLREQQTLAELENQIKKTTEAINNMKSAWDKLLSSPIPSEVYHGALGTAMEQALASTGTITFENGQLVLGDLTEAQKQWNENIESGNWQLNVPAMAAGGIVTRPTLAMIGEAGPEAVVPLNKSNSGPSQQTIIINLDGREIARQTVRHMPSIVRLQGVPI